MSDDSGNSDSSDDGVFSTRGSGSGGSSDLSVLRRAMRWETLVILLILVILTVVAS
ncbi:hypothetical protein ACWCO0_35940 [Streptomyces tubercidicus]|uniref:Uncharacterized protein n=1 Tax=Streptomyces tubercidicus TaxID=47759 RepID=A0A640UI81_9ACTN|nr:hypothetical protein [Streptomyces tubercidicus]WAU10277.1 hypothetical protein STRTU_000349 [Streptomyces tubercidicus]GFE35359.1 hypothetical protein Stube_00320 [Streptomyces tubercidicus]